MSDFMLYDEKHWSPKDRKMIAHVCDMLRQNEEHDICRGKTGDELDKEFAVRLITVIESYGQFT